LLLLVPTHDAHTHDAHTHDAHTHDAHTHDAPRPNCFLSSVMASLLIGLAVFVLSFLYGYFKYQNRRIIPNVGGVVITGASSGIGE
jgi:hypothetical protein